MQEDIITKYDLPSVYHSTAHKYTPPPLPKKKQTHIVNLPLSAAGAGQLNN